MRRPWNQARFLELLTQVMEQTASSFEELARLSDINSSTFSRWRDSKTQPNYETLRKLALWIRRQHPELEDLVPALLQAAGFGDIEIPAQQSDRILALIESAWGSMADAPEHVRTFAEAEQFPEEFRLRAIEGYIDRTKPRATGRHLREA